MSGSTEIVIGLDTASRICEACVTGSDGNIIESVNFVTSAMKLISVVSRFPDAVVVLEESSMAQWAYETLSGRVKDVFVCDPKHNKWISSGMKSDRVDAHKLTVLYRVNSLHRVYHSLDASRVEFKRTIQHREWLVKDMTRLKNEIKARFRQYGIVVAGRRSPFESPAREEWLKQLPAPAQLRVRQSFDRLEMLGLQAEEATKKVFELGRAFPEIARLVKVPGVGMIGACTFSGYVQTPHRFGDEHLLFSYASLKVITKTSAGKTLAWPRLSQSGVKPLKNMTRHAFLGALRTNRGDNPLAEYYRRHLKTCKSAHGARLSTQRKILSIMLHIWKTGEEYNSNRVLTGCSVNVETREPV
ncbi:MAG: transposase [Nitrospirota bacterium]